MFILDDKENNVDYSEELLNKKYRLQLVDTLQFIDLSRECTVENFQMMVVGGSKAIPCEEMFTFIEVVPESLRYKKMGFVDVILRSDVKNWNNAIKELEEKK